MKIIKVNDTNDKSKYEIYNMQLDDKRMRIYREEQASKIQFYRLNITFQNEMTDFIEKINSFHRIKTICEFEELPIRDAKVICGSDFNPNPFSFSTIELATYSSETPNYLTESIRKGNNQQTEFIEKFVEHGLRDYQLKSSKEWDVRSYIFLNPYVNCGKENRGTYGYTDNVVLLPYGVVALHLLELLEMEKESSDSLWFYTDYMDSNSQNDLFDNLQFSKEKNISNEEMEDLIRGNLVDQRVLTKKISLDSIFTTYIK